MCTPKDLLQMQILQSTESEELRTNTHHSSYSEKNIENSE